MSKPIDPKKLKVLLAYVLKGAGSSDGNGFQGSIQAIVDDNGQEPSEANNFLWNDEKREFKGKFVSNNQNFDFRIAESGTMEDGSPSWMSEYILSK